MSSLRDLCDKMEIFCYYERAGWPSPNRVFYVNETYFSSHYCVVEKLFHKCTFKLNGTILVIMLSFEPTSNCVPTRTGFFGKPSGGFPENFGRICTDGSFMFLNKLLSFSKNSRVYEKVLAKIDFSFSKNPPESFSINYRVFGKVPGWWFLGLSVNARESFSVNVSEGFPANPSRCFLENPQQGFSINVSESFHTNALLCFPKNSFSTLVLNFSTHGITVCSVCNNGYFFNYFILLLSCVHFIVISILQWLLDRNLVFLLF